MTQNEKILDHLKKHGKITQAEAIDKYRIYRLSARVYDLRKKGHNILTVLKSKKENGVYINYAEYHYTVPFLENP